MSNKDFYAILGVGKNATQEELKHAYRELSKKYHPDLQTGKSEAEKKEAEEKFKDINEAYSVLSDETKRKQYDRSGTADFGNGGGFDFSGIDPKEFFRRYSNFEDVDFSFGADFGRGFGTSFSGGFNRGSSNFYSANSYRAKKDGDDRRMSMEICFEEALFGTNKKFKVRFYDVCQNCNGSGAEKLEMEKCPNCGGRGTETTKIGNTVYFKKTCSRCSGWVLLPKTHATFAAEAERSKPRGK